MTTYYALGYHIVSTVSKLFFSLQILYPERSIQNGPLILAANHQSYLDPPIIGLAADREVFWLAKKTLFSWPILGKLFPKLNVIPVDIQKNDSSALRILIRYINQGKAVVIFPEGARTLDGQMQKAQPGLGMLICKTQAPVLPLRIFGAREALPRGSSNLNFTPVSIVVGEPIYFSKKDMLGDNKREIYQKLSDQVMDAIAALSLPSASY